MPELEPTPPEVAELCKSHGFVEPSRRQRVIKSVPRVGQYYWVDFPHDAYAPEFVGEHPGIVIRAARHLNDTCIIIPVTSVSQIEAKHIHKLLKNPNPKNPKLECWAVCSHLYTIHLARLRPVKIGYNPVFPKVDKVDLDGIFSCIRYALPHIFLPATLPVIT